MSCPKTNSSIRRTIGFSIMGVSNSLCDDAKSNLTVDWNLSPINYTCFHPETRFPRSFDAEPLLECDNLPPKYVPGHVCMDQEIDYTDPIPTHGDHRPLWPKFGEYMFVPRQRWLHNIEHGAVVMLYHPCAYPSEVNRLRTIVKGCVGKHVITPSTLLTPERPLALVAWGCRLLMSAVDDEMAMKFIQARAHKGPEGTYTKEGQYELWLLNEAKSSGAGAKYGYSKVSCDAIDRTAL
ncbi:Tumor protein p53-inducible protein 13 [Orchesella cincta]|uniref:Tumor protein p53-inducible protein 13 n=1 Tax=Orchesella cincta TaxID=48709 RepID=A0A1D2MP50_ORCCI|nr:Tumor protein p53-inducible protein 13 [Orchesella cincta]